MYGAQCAGALEVQSAEDTQLDRGEDNQGPKQNYCQVNPQVIRKLYYLHSWIHRRN